MVHSSNFKRRVYELRMAKEMTKQLRYEYEIKRSNLACIEKVSEALLSPVLTDGMKFEALDLFHRMIN